MVAQASAVRWVGMTLRLLPASLHAALDAWSREVAKRKAAARWARVAQKRKLQPQ